MRAILVNPLIGRRFIIDKVSENGYNLPCHEPIKLINTPYPTSESAPNKLLIVLQIRRPASSSTLRGFYQTRDKGAKMVEIVMLEEILII